MSTREDPFDRGGFTREALLEAIRLGEGRFTKRELARALSLKGDAKIGLREALKALEEDGAVIRTATKAYAIRGGLPPVTVVEAFDRDVDGEILCRATNLGSESPVIRLAPGEGKGRRGDSALGVGDKFLARLERENGEYTARIIKKLGRSAHRILCVYRETGRGSARLVPVDRRTKHELVPAKGEGLAAKDGDLVNVRLASGKAYGLKTGIVEEVLGSADDPRAGSLIALAEHGVPTGFGEPELKEVKAIRPVTAKGREDLTDIPLITIDPADAKDHDDAVWAAADDDAANKGGWVVIVAIADVAAYVTGGSALDKGARKRGVSVYLPDRVEPMLPERLSNDLCSLKEGENRPCLAVRMVFDRNGNKKAHRFLRGWMRSAAGLSYEDAQAAIDGKGKGKAETLKTDVLEPLWGAYAALKKAREAREPLEIDAPERKVQIGPDGAVTGVAVRERFDAHKLIEEMMIQANVAAAEALESAKSPLIYRVHDEPGTEKVEALSDFLPTVGLSWARGERLTTKRFNQVLQRAKGGPHYETVNEVVLRTQSQAIYDTRNVGHFGLNLDKYAHFTSPIRRYADLTVHRALIRAFKLGNDGASDEERASLQVIAEETTSNERRAMAAERDATDRFIAAFLADRVGAEFAGRITGVTRFGAFIRLDETGADALCPVSRLGREYFQHDPAAHALVGENTGATYRLGMAVTVRLEEATPVTGGLLVEIVTPPEQGRKPMGRRKGGRPPAGRDGRSRGPKGKRRR
ncbi:ribonuclease R [Glycocaulis sp.]|uniref:ribonuclease R n=1 Tax=Glycocaulis sp. TaxID=1969725 RepID=UPI0025C37935|nr:ribonuclease R [Glycocaulis sp.]MCH8522433.1 ribonuclease R [Glycocaulis sp.]